MPTYCQGLSIAIYILLQDYGFYGLEPSKTMNIYNLIYPYIASSPGITNQRIKLT